MPWRVTVGREEFKASPELGYVAITREWRKGDVVELDFPLRVRAVRGNDKIAATQGRVAFENGPVVYCVEEIDQKITPDALAAPFKIMTGAGAGTFKGVTVLALKGATGAMLTAVPYFAWNNCGLAPMAVWLPVAGK